MTRLSGLFAVVLLATSCQTYDFERVVPLAVAQTTDKTVVASKRLKPNVMLLVDNSGSMLLPTNPSNPNCPSGCGTSSMPCPAQCPTRVSEMKSAMSTFLQSSGKIARLGVTIYPTDILCQPARNIDVQLPTPTPTDDGSDATLQDTANQINARIQSLQPQGGTPTGSSLEFLGTYGGINDAADFRDDFVLLLTDGLPNCNDANVNALCGCAATCSMAQVSACGCTTSTCSNALCAKGCLDKDGAVEKVKALKQKSIRTIVVGFGADLASGAGPDVLNAMAREGDFARKCENGTDAECGGAAGSCNTATKLCATSFFQAANGAELAAALASISDAITGDPCVYPLKARPSEARFLAVIINGQSLAAGSDTYAYDFAANEVTFQGTTCTQLKTSTTQNPVNVEFRIVERF